MTAVANLDFFSQFSRNMHHDSTAGKCTDEGSSHTSESGVDAFTPSTLQPQVETTRQRPPSEEPLTYVKEFYDLPFWSKLSFTRRYAEECYCRGAAVRY